MAKNKIDGGNIFDLQNIQQTFERISSMFDNLKRKVDEISSKKIVFSGDNGSDLKNMTNEINSISKAVIDLTKAEKDLINATKLKNEAEKIASNQAKESLNAAKSLDAQRQKAYAMLAKEEYKQREQVRLLTDLNAKYKANNITIKELGQLWNLAKKELDGYTTSQIKSSKEARDLQKHVASLGKEYDKLKQAQGVGSQNVGRYWESMKGGLMGVAGAFGLAVGGAQLLGNALTSGFGIIREYGKEWATLKSVLGSVTQKELNDIIFTNNRVSKELGTSVIDIIKLQQELAKLGMSANQVSASTPGIVALATATGENPTLSASTLTGTMNAYKISFAETTRIANIMNRTLNESGTGLSDYSEGIKYVATDARLAGVSFEQLNSMIALLADNNIKGSMAGTSLRKIMVKLKDESGPLSEKLKKISESGVGMDEALNEAGLTARTTLNILLGGIPKMDAFGKSLEDAAGNAEKMNKQLGIMTDTMDTDIKKAGSAWISMVERLNTANSGLGKGIRFLIQQWTELINTVGSTSKSKAELKNPTIYEDAETFLNTRRGSSTQKEKLNLLAGQQAKYQTDILRISETKAKLQKELSDISLFSIIKDPRKANSLKREIENLDVDLEAAKIRVETYQKVITKFIGVAEKYDASKTKLRDPNSGLEETTEERKARLAKEKSLKIGKTESKNINQLLNDEIEFKKLEREMLLIEDGKTNEQRKELLLQFDEEMALLKIERMIANSDEFTTLEIEKAKLDLLKIRESLKKEISNSSDLIAGFGATNDDPNAPKQEGVKISFIDKIMKSIFGANTSDEQLSNMKGAFQKAGQIILDGLNNILNIRSQALDQEIALRDKNISDIQSKIETEKQLQDERKNKGEAYDNAKIKQLENQIVIEKVARQKALNEQKKIANAQFAVDAAIQASNMITAFTSIVAAFAKTSPWGWILGIASGALMLGAMVAQKKAINSQFKAREGDYRSFDGAPTHEQGGIQTAHSGVEAEGGEAQTIWTKRAIMKNGGHANMKRITNLVNKGVLFSDLTKFDGGKNTNIFVGGMSDERMVGILQKMYDLNRNEVKRDGKITYDIHKNQIIKTA